MQIKNILFVLVVSLPVTFVFGNNQSSAIIGLKEVVLGLGVSFIGVSALEAYRDITRNRKISTEQQQHNYYIQRLEKPVIINDDLQDSKKLQGLQDKNRVDMLVSQFAQDTESDIGAAQLHVSSVDPFVYAGFDSGKSMMFVNFRESDLEYDFCNFEADDLGIYTNIYRRIHSCQDNNSVFYLAPPHTSRVRRENKSKVVYKEEKTFAGGVVATKIEENSFTPTEKQITDQLDIAFELDKEVVIFRNYVAEGFDVQTLAQRYVAVLTCKRRYEHCGELLPALQRFKHIHFSFITSTQEIDDQVLAQFQKEFASLGEVKQEIDEYNPNIDYGEELVSVDDLPELPQKSLLSRYKVSISFATVTGVVLAAYCLFPNYRFGL